jgi:hypothetical protein
LGKICSAIPSAAKVRIVSSSKTPARGRLQPGVALEHDHPVPALPQERGDDHADWSDTA